MMCVVFTEVLLFSPIHSVNDRALRHVVGAHFFSNTTKFWHKYQSAFFQKSLSSKSQRRRDMTWILGELTECSHQYLSYAKAKETEEVS